MNSRADLRVLALTGGMAVVAAVLWLSLPTAVAPVGDAPSMHPLVLAGLVAVGELCAIHIYFSRETHTLSLREIPFVVGLFVVAPLHLAIAYVAGTIVVLAIRARQRGIKLLFNLAMLALEVGVGVAVFRTVLGNAGLLEPRAWIAALLAAVAVDALGALMVSLAIWLHQGTAPDSVGWLALIGAVTIANASFGLLLVIVLSTVPAAGFLLGIVAGMMFAGYRSYTGLRRRHSHLALLQRFSAAIGSALTFEEVALGAVREARNLLEADRAELWFLPPGSKDDVVRITIDGANAPTIEMHQPLEFTETLWKRLDATNDSVLVRRRERNDQLRVVLESHDCKDLIASPMRTERGLVGMLIVGNRLGDVATFDPDDARLLAILSRHTSVVLENGRLVDELQQVSDRREHEALHDPLTGLANRRSFVERAQRTLRRLGTHDRMFAVLLLDLDGFKDVNDTYGHSAGDELLIEVSRRLHYAVRGPDTIARLGGDEFAVLLSDVATADEALLGAARLYEAVALPCVVNGVTIQVDASIGIAAYPQDGRDIATLLRCADIAMYTAKEQKTNYVVYCPAQDQNTPERLALAADLRAAIENESFSIAYQPTKDLKSGWIVGVEALARWEHPTRGLLPPPVYIAVAEQTSLIRELTRYVLRRALEQRRAWAEHDIDLRVSVNVSVHDLQSKEFTTEVALALEDSGTPPGRLALEIAETQAMEHPERIAPVLIELRRRGVVIAIDDFGTGHASLTSLRSLPIDEIKIDRRFIRDLAIDHRDDATVRSMIELARRLQLRIFAEGVETDDTERQLDLLGCDVVQGYVLSPALPAPDLETWLHDHDHDHDRTRCQPKVVSRGVAS